MQGAGNAKREIDFAPAHVRAAIVDDDLTEVAAVTDDKTGPKRQGAMGGRHAKRVEFAAGGDAAVLPIDGGNHYAWRPCTRRGQGKAQQSCCERSLQKHVDVRKPLVCRACYRAAARAERKAGNLMHNTTPPP